MTPSNASLTAWRLYVILDRAAARGRDLTLLADAAIAGGADVLQLRDKASAPDDLIDAARPLRELTHRHRIPLIINDHPDVAAAVGADGVHLGQTDLPTATARRILGQGKLVGRSTHSLDQALAAEREGADYLGVGPIFATPTKPTYWPVGLSLMQLVAPRLRIPWVAIGGIDASNVRSVVRAGARCVAVVRAVTGAAEPAAAARTLKHLIHEEAEPLQSAANGWARSL